MPRKTKEERIAEIDQNIAKEQAERKELEKEIAEENRKKRTKNLIEAGKVVERCLGTCDPATIEQSLAGAKSFADVYAKINAGISNNVAIFISCQKDEDSRGHLLYRCWQTWDDVNDGKFHRKQIEAVDGNLTNEETS